MIILQNGPSTNDFVWFNLPPHVYFCVKKTNAIFSAYLAIKNRDSNWKAVRARKWANNPFFDFKGLRSKKFVRLTSTKWRPVWSHPNLTRLSQQVLLRKNGQRIRHNLSVMRKKVNSRHARFRSVDLMSKKQLLQQTVVGDFETHHQFVFVIRHLKKWITETALIILNLILVTRVKVEYWNYLKREMRKNSEPGLLSRIQQFYF